MSNARLLIQCRQELESWKRILELYSQENFNLKLRLIEMLNQLEWQDQLPEAEMFQDDFIAQELVFQFLQAEIADQDEYLKLACQTGCLLPEELEQKQKKIRSDIWKAEQIFNEIKKAFNEAATIYLEDIRIF